jgi:DNA-binding MarR family transcriptional regulator
MIESTLEQVVLDVFAKAAGGVWQTKTALKQHKELRTTLPIAVGNCVDRLFRKGLVEREKVRNGGRAYHYRLVQRPVTQTAAELKVLYVLAQGETDDWFTRTSLRQSVTLEKMDSQTLDMMLGRLSQDGLVVMRRLNIQGKPWGYQITDAGRRVLDPKHRASSETKQEPEKPTTPDWLADVILKTLLARPEIGLWSIPELGGRLVLPCVGQTITAEDVTAACNNLMERRLVALWGEPANEVSLNIPRGIGLDGQRIRGQGAVTTTMSNGEPPPFSADAVRVRQLRLDYEAARELAKTELAARHKVEQELADEKARRNNVEVVLDVAHRRQAEAEMKLRALAACFQGLFGNVLGKVA